MEKIREWFRGEYVKWLYKFAFGKSKRLHRWARNKISADPCPCTYCETVRIYARN